MDIDLSRDSLFRETEKTLRAITAPSFLEAMQKFRSLSGEERIAFAKENMTPHALSKKGVPLPDDMRVSSRTFEEGPEGHPRHLDYKTSAKILSYLKISRPDMIERLKSTNPELYRDLEALDQMQGNYAARIAGLGGPGLGGPGLGGPGLGGPGLGGPGLGGPGLGGPGLGGPGLGGPGLGGPGLGGPGLGDPDPGGPVGGPLDPGTGDPLGPDNNPLDPYGAWACACGGAATACGGAGGGT